MKFNDTTNKNGLIQALERMTGTQSGLSSAYPLADKTRDINLALDNYNILANDASGRWQSSDDTNHQDYPITYADLLTGIQDYTFKVDEQRNQILDIYKVRVKYPDGTWHTLTQRDFQTQDEEVDFTTTGKPTEYDLTANGIFLTVIPDYDMTDGLEIWYSRTNSYFVATDTTKEPGIPNIFHQYLVLRPAYFFCLEKGLPQASAYKIALYGQDGKSGMEQAIQNFHARRNRAEKPRLIANVEDCK
jgi:hypothetical protein